MDYRSTMLFAMLDKQEIRGTAHAQQEEALFIFRMLRIEELRSEIVAENCAGFVERYTVLPQVSVGFRVIPLELYYPYIVWIK